MSTSTLLAFVAMTAAVVSGATTAQTAQASAQPPRDGGPHRADSNMRAVTNPSLPDQAGHGWQYFSDPRAVRAVVISPVGEYFLSRGEGLRQITGPTGPASTGRPAAR